MGDMSEIFLSKVQQEKIDVDMARLEAKLSAQEAVVTKKVYLPLKEQKKRLSFLTKKGLGIRKLSYVPALPKPKPVVCRLVSISGNNARFKAYPHIERTLSSDYAPAPALTGGDIRFTGNKFEPISIIPIPHYTKEERKIFIGGIGSSGVGEKLPENIICELPDWLANA